MENVKGFKDFVGAKAEKREAVRKIIAEAFEKYGFKPAETPLVEFEEFVKGENENDEAVSDIFKLQDKGKRKLALRYEFTFQLKRLMENQKLPFKRFQIGPVFRDEPVGEKRFRQFTQCDADIVGVSENPARDEAEIFAMASEIFKKIGIKIKILINNRKLINEILQAEGIAEKNFDFVLREIDKFGKISESEIKKNLKKFQAEKILDKMKKGEKFFSQFESYKKIISLIDYCRTYNVEIFFSPTIVRGLSYYNGTVFEIKSEKIKETIAAGGAYEFNKVQSFGISFGLNRLSILSNLKLEKKDFLIVSLNEDRQAIKIAQKLRQQGFSVNIYYGKPSKALEFANSYEIEKVIFVGAREVKKKKFKIKNMISGKEKEITLEKISKKNIVLKK